MRVEQLAHNGPLRLQLQQLYILAIAAADNENEPPARHSAWCLTESSVHAATTQAGVQRAPTARLVARIGGAYRDLHAVGTRHLKREGNLLSEHLIFRMVRLTASYIATDGTIQCHKLIWNQTTWTNEQCD